MVARHNIVIIILAVFLAASMIGLFFLYPPYQSMKQTLQECQKRLSEQDKKVAALSEDQTKQMKSTYEALVSTLKEEINKQEVTIKGFEEAVSLTFIDRILFEFGKATLTPEGAKILEKVGAAVKNVTEKRIRVTGHADNVPIHPDYKYLFPTNWELSGARAASVVRYFQQKAGVDPKDMEAVGRSFYQPVASNETNEGRAQNRRVEIFIAPQMEIKRK
jgi:chemotaxis protein MotB